MLSQKLVLHTQEFKKKECKVLLKFLSLRIVAEKKLRLSSEIEANGLQISTHMNIFKRRKM